MATPGSVSYSLPPNSQAQPDQESSGNVQTNETTEDYSNVEPDQMKFFEDTDCKKLQDKTTDINKNLVDVERILRELQPIVIKDAPEFVPILVDQSDSNVSGTQFMNNYRWITKVQEMISSTSLPVYKRYGLAYNMAKSTKYKNYSIKPIKKE